MKNEKNDQALSISQPWAWLIINGFKDIENRDWDTKFRGRFLVHAAFNFDYDGYEYILKNFKKIKLPTIDEFLRGGFIGSVELTKVVTKSESDWFTGKYGFVLAKPKPMSFIEVPGQENFFEVK